MPSIPVMFSDICYIYVSKREKIACFEYVGYCVIFSTYLYAHCPNKILI